MGEGEAAGRPAPEAFAGIPPPTALTAPVVRVALCDPRRWFREALAHRLNVEPDIRVLWTMATLEELDAAPWVADVIVTSVDDRLDRRTIDALALVGRHHPGAALLALASGRAQLALLWPRLRRSGVATVLARSDGIPALVDELRHRRGEGGHRPATGPAGIDRRVRSLLSPREQEVLEWLAAGWTVNEIAAGLGLAAKTVANCKQRLYRKLDVHHQAHAVATAITLGLLVPDAREQPVPSWS
jgi:DNA-binding CsgD family transcriptional regulator